MIPDSQQGHAVTSPGVQLRPYPYPYRCMLAICSDLDSTPNRQVYWEIMRFLNTTETTAMGLGVGLEVGNSIHFRAIPPQFSYWDTDDAGREMVHTLIHSGHIDCLHSFGECVHTRGEAKQALDELERHDCWLEVWVDHGSAVTNFGWDIMDGHGDEVGHMAYHADLTIPYGVKYVWRGRTTSVIGQDVPPRLAGIFKWNHPASSGRTFLKEIAKRSLALAGNQKYAMHGPNETIRPIRLRDGSAVYEFMRCNPHWGGISSCDEGRHIGAVLTREMLSRLVEREGTCILYTHLGKISDPRVPFDADATTAFRRLREEFLAGRILVTTTRRLLGYRRALREVTFATRLDGKSLHLEVNTESSKDWGGELSRADVAGLTFYVPDPANTSMTIDGQQVAELRCNHPDQTGRPSVSLPWARLEFPEV